MAVRGPEKHTAGHETMHKASLSIMPSRLCADCQKKDSFSLQHKFLQVMCQNSTITSSLLSKLHKRLHTLHKSLFATDNSA